MTAQKMMSWMDRAAMTVAVLLAALPLLTVVAGASIL
jgi:acyl-CoA hydrolase